MTELLDAVDALTLVTNRRVTQNILTTLLITHEEGFRLSRPEEQQQFTGKSRTVIATEPPLLQQLDDAVAASIGGSSSGATLPSERAILRADALYQAVLIRNEIRDWCRLEGITEARGRTSSEQLRAWYTARYAAGNTESEWHLKELKRWAAVIRGLIDPLRTLELPRVPCPLPDCEATTWWDRESGEEKISPLIIRYREGADLIDKATATCRACGTEWGVRELAWQLEHPDTPDEATTGAA